MSTMEPTTPQNLRLIQATIDQIQGLMLNLYARWQGEKGHEDIQDYAAPIRQALPTAVTLVKMTKRPFGFEFTVEAKKYACTLVGRSYGWKRVA